MEEAVTWLPFSQKRNTCFARSLGPVALAAYSWNTKKEEAPSISLPVWFAFVRVWVYKVLSYGFGSGVAAYFSGSHITSIWTWKWDLDIASGSVRFLSRPELMRWRRGNFVKNMWNWGVTYSLYGVVQRRHRSGQIPIKITWTGSISLALFFF